MKEAKEEEGREGGRREERKEGGRDRQREKEHMHEKQPMCMSQNNYHC